MSVGLTFEVVEQESAESRVAFGMRNVADVRRGRLPRRQPDQPLPRTAATWRSMQVSRLWASRWPPLWSKVYSGHMGDCDISGDR